MTLKITCALLLACVDLSFQNALNRQNDSGELLSVQFIFRHGARTPLFVLPSNDPYSNYSWPNGLGALTEKGIEQMFRYGQVVRKRYWDYLKKIDNSRNIIVKSSPIRRCIDTSIAFLYGFVPKWQHQINVTIVEWLTENFKCPSVDRLFNANMTLDIPQMRTLIENNQELTEQVVQYSRFKIEPKWFALITVQDTLDCERHFFGESFKWPWWMATIGHDCWQRLIAFRNAIHGVAQFFPKKYARLKVGSLLLDLLANLVEANLNNETKVHAYATHDTVISILLIEFGLYSEQPHFGSGLIVELRKHAQSSKAHVHLLYSNVTDSDDHNNIYQLHLNSSSTFKPLCKESSCDLIDFTSSLLAYFPVDVDKECNDLA